MVIYAAVDRRGQVYVIYVKFLDECEFQSCYNLLALGTCNYDNVLY
jgi:hypothetical protein